MSILIDVQDLQVSFSTPSQIINVVRGVSFALETGETLGVIGESGSGKSTLCKALLKLLSENALLKGNILFQNKNIVSCTEKEMLGIRSNQMAFIAQDSMTSLNPTMKIGGQMIEAFRKSMPGVSLVPANEMCCQYLEKLDLQQSQNIMQAYPHMLSGGMRQRILIAFALIRKPQLIIADEPTTALDRELKQKVLQLLKNEVPSLLLVSHDLESVAKYCDKVIVMHEGRVVEAATTRKLFSHPQHPYTKALLNSRLNIRIDKNKFLMDHVFNLNSGKLN